jgi:hypothetical protein
MGSGRCGEATSRLAQFGKGGELLDVILISASSVWISDVGEPFELGRYVGEVAELGRRQRAAQLHRSLTHHPTPRAPCFKAPCPRPVFPNLKMDFIRLGNTREIVSRTLAACRLR